MNPFFYFILLEVINFVKRVQKGCNSSTWDVYKRKKEENFVVAAIYS